MKKVIGTALASVLALSAVVTPASAVPVCYEYCPPKVVSKGGSSGFPLAVACVMGSAAGLIFASIRKGGGLHLMSQAEFERTPRDKSKELTNDEAKLIMLTCGLATFLVGKQAPVTVKAKY